MFNPIIIWRNKARICTIIIVCYLGWEFLKWNSYGQQNRTTTNGMLQNEQEQQENTCDEIHIATVVGQLKYLFSFAMFVKSVIATRKNPIQMHLLVDEKSKPIVSEMLDSWAIEHFKYQFISIEEHIHHVSDIQNKHYSSHYTQLKLLVPLVLKHLDLVIVADYDLLFTQDIVILWNKLKEMQRRDIPFAMVPDQMSPSYVRPEDWPALVSHCHLNIFLSNNLALHFF